MASYYRNKKIIIFVIVLITLFVLAVGAGVYYFMKIRNYETRISDIDTEDYSVKVLVAQSDSIREPAGLPITQVSEETIGDGIYMTPLGFPIISNSQNWQGSKLVEIYDELLRNTHGEEINYIAKVVVQPGMSELGTADSIIAGTHSTTQEHYMVFFDIPIVPASLEYGITSKQSVIELFNMDEYDTIEQAARTISHEYGHHYTIYYFMNDDNMAAESEYFQIRDFENYSYPIFFNSQESYLNNHEWSIYEIAAEDYVQLFGSENAKQVRLYMDVYDALRSNDGKDYRAQADETTSNVFPQENLRINLADDVDGLRDYYYSFIDQENEFEALEEVDFNIQMKKRSAYGYTYYEITWDNVYSDKDALYTLVCFDADYNIFSPIKTLQGDEKPIARVGTVSRVSGSTLTTYTNAVTDENRYFRLHVVLPDGRIIASDYFYADF